MIQTQRLTRDFGQRRAVSELTLDVEAGEVFGFLGPNGAGKTTVMRMLSGLIAPSSGEARVVGHDVRTQATEVRRRIGLLTETPGLYRRLSAEENLKFYAGLYGVSNTGEAARRTLEALGLGDRRQDPVGSLSKGMRQAVAIARALVHDPQLVFLDEPTSGLDPEAAVRVHSIIRELKAMGRTVFLCTHHLDEAERLCDRIGVFKRQLIAVDTPAGLRATRLAPKTIVALARRDEAIARAVLSLGFVKGVQWREQDLVITLAEPERDNPALVRKVVEAGGLVTGVAAERASLEQVYLSLTGSLRLE